MLQPATKQKLQDVAVFWSYSKPRQQPKMRHTVGPKPSSCHHFRWDLYGFILSLTVARSHVRVPLKTLTQKNLSDEKRTHKTSRPSLEGVLLTHSPRCVCPC